MRRAYVICGYGLPKDILTDQNYDRYLTSALELIVKESSGAEALIVLSGGLTNCEPPYLGTEAEAMEVWMRRAMAREGSRGGDMTGWEIIREDRSLSSLENLVNSSDLIKRIGGVEQVTIFCEHTRAKRIEDIAGRIFKGFDISVYPVDFDVSKNRHLDPEVLKRREDDALRESLWVLEDPARLERHHRFFQSKIDYLRKRQSEGLSHVDAVKEWIEREPGLLRELMPDHPLLKPGETSKRRTQRTVYGFWFWAFLVVTIAVAAAVYDKVRRDRVSDSPEVTFVPVISPDVSTEASAKAFAERDGEMLKVMAKSGDGAVILYGFGTCEGIFSIGVPQLSDQGFEYPLAYKESVEATESGSIGSISIDSAGVIRMNVTSTVAERGCKLSVMKK